MTLDEENTFRALKDEPAIQTWRCRIGWHRWTKWQYKEGDFSVGRPHLSVCKCADCNLPKVRYVIPEKEIQR